MGSAGVPRANRRNAGKMPALRFREIVYLVALSCTYNERRRENHDALSSLGMLCRDGFYGRRRDVSD